MATWEQVKQRRRAPEVRVPVQLDGTVQARIDDLRRQVAHARSMGALEEISASLADESQTSQILAMEKQLQQLLDESRDSVQVFVMRGLSYDEVEDLKADHPPTAEQREQEQLLWNPETFAPALIAACSVVVQDPVDPDQPDGPTTEVGVSLTEADAVDMKATLGPGLVGALYEAAWNVCHAKQVVRSF